MKKEFIPYEQALALKELGFDEFTVAAYVDNELDIGGLWKDSVKSKDIQKAPLYQQAFRWFRENYGIGFYESNSFPSCEDNKVYAGIKSYTDSGKSILLNSRLGLGTMGTILWRAVTYEEA